ncbi:hypothetical protein LZK82_17195 [Rhizobium leguminosarum]|nr:hypothetical protein LZK82_17195 [Rhizobium leguminosarum]
MTMDTSTVGTASQLKENQISFYQPVGGNAETIGLCELHTADCVEILPEIPDGSIDLIVTSPPYNIGKPYETRSALDTYADFSDGGDQRMLPRPRKSRIDLLAGGKLGRCR